MASCCVGTQVPGGCKSRSSKLGIHYFSIPGSISRRKLGKADIALIGLAVMGQNLILNMNDHGFVVCAYNRTIAKVTDFLSKEAKDTNIIGASSLRDMVSKLKKPRKVMLLVKAGVAVDEFVKNLIPLLEKGDIIIDGGNSQYIVTQRWCKELDATGIFYVGVGTQKSLFNTKWTIDLCRPALLLSASEANKEDLKEATILHPRLEAVVQDPEYRCMLHEPEGFTRIQTQKSLFNTKWTIDLCRPALLLSASEANKEDLKEATILHPRLEAVVQDPEYRCMLHEPEGFTRIQVSGGEDGARYGPSLMPGGHSAAWPHVKPIFQAICAKVNNEPCCDWVGEDGAGHFVKMVHNGIEYGDMQLICEAYSLMKAVLGMEQDEMAQVFEEWNRGELNSFLIEITRDILKFKDADGKYLLPKIRDTAGQKGTGKWTGITALEYGVPVTLIGEAVFARCLSSIKDERVKASHVLPGSSMKFTGNKKEFLEHLRKALYASKIISYAQGFMLLREAAKVNNWNLNYGSIALMWRGGCIIRSVFLGNIKEAFTKNCALTNLLLDPYFCREISSSQGSLRQVMAQAALVGVPAPAFAAALSFYDGYRSSVLPANLLQAQRDYFGAHMYELLSKPGEFVHTNWTGYGGNVSASTYNN